MSDMGQGNTENFIGDSGENDELIKKSDVILLAFIILIAIFALIYIMSTRKSGARVKISYDGDVVETFELSEDREHQVTTEKGKNVIMIKNGNVDVIEADCPDKICVKHTNIKNAGETIICLPHKLVIEIVE
ncbi:MAG: NusG domain II-containing protein [Lachnospiraceae bacterium]|nr:NusG domain II-containing protein [Lachnospiraceae bacterium]